MPVSYHTAECPYRFTDRRRTSAWLRECIAREGKACGDVNVVFCRDAYLLDLNRRFLDHDYFTDIITFDYSAGGVVGGELYISIDTVADNAARFGADPRREMLRVIVHGVLHLCGYGDKTPEEESVMRAKEDACLALFDTMR